MAVISLASISLTASLNTVEGGSHGGQRTWIYEEFEDKAIWIADVEGEHLSLWQIVADTEEIRRAYGIPS